MASWMDNIKGQFAKLNNNQPAQLGLLSAGAAMLDPRGTNGNIGSSINKSVQAGLGTYVPLMQWQQNKKDRKEDRDWRKQQDTIQNVLQERTYKMRKQALEGEAENREVNTNIRRAQFGLMEEKANREIAQLQAQSAAMSQFASGQKPNPEYANQPPPMSINPATGQPFGNRVSKTLPMTDQDKMMMLAQMQQGGMNSGAASTLMKSQFSKTDPSSPNYSSSADKGATIDVLARRMVKEGKAKTYEDAKMQLMQKMDPMAQMMQMMMTEQPK